MRRCNSGGDVGLGGGELSGNTHPVGSPPSPAPPKQLATTKVGTPTGGKGSPRTQRIKAANSPKEAESPSPLSFPEASSTSHTHAVDEKMEKGGGGVGTAGGAGEAEGGERRPSRQVIRDDIREEGRRMSLMGVDGAKAVAKGSAAAFTSSLMLGKQTHALEVFKESGGLKVVGTDLASRRTMTFAVTDIPVISHVTLKQKRDLWYSNFVMSLQLRSTEEAKGGEGGEGEGRGGSSGGGSGGDSESKQDSIYFDDEVFSEMDPLSAAAADYSCDAAAIGGKDYAINVFQRKHMSAGIMIQAACASESGDSSDTELHTILLPEHPGIPSFVKGGKREAFFVDVVSCLSMVAVPTMGTFLTWVEPDDDDDD